MSNNPYSDIEQGDAHVKAIVRHLMKHSGNVTVNNITVEGGVNFPLKTPAELAAFNTLGEDRGFKVPRGPGYQYEIWNNGTLMRVLG